MPAVRSQGQMGRRRRWASFPHAPPCRVNFVDPPVELFARQGLAKLRLRGRRAPSIHDVDAIGVGVRLDVLCRPGKGAVSPRCGGRFPSDSRHPTPEGRRTSTQSTPSPAAAPSSVPSASALALASSASAHSSSSSSPSSSRSCCRRSRAASRCLRSCYGARAIACSCGRG